MPKGQGNKVKVIFTLISNVLTGVEEFLDEQIAMVVPAGSPYLTVINKE